MTNEHHLPPVRAPTRKLQMIKINKVASCYLLTENIRVRNVILNPWMNTYIYTMYLSILMVYTSDSDADGRGSIPGCGLDGVQT